LEQRAARHPNPVVPPAPPLRLRERYVNHKSCVKIAFARYVVLFIYHL
jgi:hypothetical protein